MTVTERFLGELLDSADGKKAAVDSVAEVSMRKTFDLSGVTA